MENGEWRLDDDRRLRSPFHPAAPAPVPGAASPRARLTRSQPSSPQLLQPPSRGRPRVGHAARGASPPPPRRLQPHLPGCSSPISPAAPAPVPGAAPSQEPPMWTEAQNKTPWNIVNLRCLPHCATILVGQDTAAPESQTCLGLPQIPTLLDRIPSEYKRGPMNQAS